MRVLMVCGTWGHTCGVAEYTRDLMHALAGVGVQTEVAVGPAEIKKGYDRVHLQHEYSMYPTSVLQAIIERVARIGVPLVVTQHACGDHSHAQEHNRILAQAAARLVVHTPEMLALLSVQGVPVPKMTVVPLGCRTLTDVFLPPTTIRRVLGIPQDAFAVGFFGFLGRHKGIVSLCCALRDLPGVTGFIQATRHFYRGSLTPEAIYADLGMPYSGGMRYVHKNLIFSHRTLADVEVARYMHAMDVNILPYDDGPVIAASAAARVLLATHRGLVTTRVSWFSDLAGATLQIPVDGRAEEIRKTVLSLQADPGLVERLAERARAYAEDHSWPRVAEHYRGVYQV